MNRAGISWLTEDTGKIIIGVICVVILLGFAIKLYAFVKTDNESAIMKVQLETLSLAIEQSSTEKQEKIIELFPKIGWYLKSFPDNDFPQGNCRGDIGCICFCKTIECTDKRECSSFSFDVKVDETERKKIFGDPEAEPILFYTGSVELRSLEQLRIFPQGDFIVIQRAEERA